MTKWILFTANLDARGSYISRSLWRKGSICKIKCSNPKCTHTMKRRATSWYRVNPRGQTLNGSEREVTVNWSMALKIRRSTGYRTTQWVRNRGRDTLSRELGRVRVWGMWRDGYPSLGALIYRTKDHRNSPLPPSPPGTLPFPPFLYRVFPRLSAWTTFSSLILALTIAS